MDPIADMIIRIKNASQIGRRSVSFPYSNLKFAIAAALEKEGFLREVARKGKKPHKLIEAEIGYVNDRPRIQGLRRLSKPARRIYRRPGNLPSVRRGFGRAILSTSAGILTDRQARAKKVGGEILFEIW